MRTFFLSLPAMLRTSMRLFSLPFPQEESGEGGNADNIVRAKSEDSKTSSWSGSAGNSGGSSATAKMDGGNGISFDEEPCSKYKKKTVENQLEEILVRNKSVHHILKSILRKRYSKYNSKKKILRYTKIYSKKTIYSKN